MLRKIDCLDWRGYYYFVLTDLFVFLLLFGVGRLWLVGILRKHIGLFNVKITMSMIINDSY